MKQLTNMNYKFNNYQLNMATLANKHISSYRVYHVNKAINMKQNTDAYKLQTEVITTNLSSKRFVRQHCSVTSTSKKKAKYKPKQKTIFHNPCN